MSSITNRADLIIFWIIWLGSLILKVLSKVLIPNNLNRAATIVMERNTKNNPVKRVRFEELSSFKNFFDSACSLFIFLLDGNKLIFKFSDFLGVGFFVNFLALAKSSDKF